MPKYVLDALAKTKDFEKTMDLIKDIWREEPRSILLNSFQTGRCPKV
jgi:hypothetical protein